MTGLITTHIINTIAAQVDEQGVVVWYDPDGFYQDVPAQIDLAETTVAEHEGSYYALRHLFDALLEGERPPRPGGCQRIHRRPRILPRAPVRIDLRPGRPTRPR